MKNLYPGFAVGLGVLLSGCGALLDALESDPHQRSESPYCSPTTSSHLAWGDRNEGHLYYEQRLLRMSATPQAASLTVARIDSSGYDLRISFRRAGYGAPEVIGLELGLSRYADPGQTRTLQTTCRANGDQIFTCEIRDARVTLNRSTSDSSTLHQVAQALVTYRIGEGPDSGTYTATFSRSDIRYSGCVYGTLGRVYAGDLGTETFPPAYELN